jgi:histone H3/H4
MQTTGDVFKKCGTCKKPIAFEQKYWVCSVSSCNRARFALTFCTVGCWDAHNPVMNHRSSWAEEKTAPPRPKRGGDSDELRERLTRQMAAPAKSAQDKETLIVASKLKNYIKARSGMNTSADVLEVLSDFVRHQANDAIDRAREEGRRTVKARDFLV